MTRAEAIAIIEAHAKGELREEIDRLVQESVDDEWDEPYDALDAFVEVASKSNYDCWKSLRRPALAVAVRLGQYRPISDEDARQAVASGLGVKMRDFPRLHGQRYECVMSDRELDELA